MDDLDLYYTRRLALEQALAGAALLDDAAADLLLAEVPLNDVLCSVSQAALEALSRIRDEQPVRYMIEPTLDLVLEELELTGELREDLGGRDAVAALVEDRPELRRARASLSAALKAMAAVGEEPVVQFAAVELGVDQVDRDQLDPSRDSLPSPAPVTRSRQRAPSQPSQRSRRTGRPGGAP